MNRLVHQGDDTFDYNEVPVNFADGKGRWAQFSVQAPNRSQADDQARLFRNSMLQVPCPAQIRPYLIAESEVLDDGGVRYSIFSVAALTSFDFQWNGLPLFDLQDASLSLLNGWQVTTVFVPASMVHTPSGLEPATNEADIVFTGPHGEISFEVTVTVHP